MKKLLKIIIILILLGGTFLLGIEYGVRSVILNQEIWEEDGYFYSDYKGQVHEYE